MIKPLLSLVLPTALLVVLALSSTPTVNVKAVAANPEARQEYGFYDIRTGERSARPVERSTDARYKIDYNDELGYAEVIDGASDTSALASTGSASRATVLRNFVTANPQIFGLTSTSQLRQIADYTNPDGNLSYAHFVQEIDGVPVFGSEVKAGFSKSGGMFRVINTLARDLDGASLARDFGSAEASIVRAAPHVGLNIDQASMRSVPTNKLDVKEFTGVGSLGNITAEKFYFPLGNGEARPAWRVMFRGNESAYYVVVDAVDGTLLWRRDLVVHQLLPATYSVYGNLTSPLKTADSPSPLSPGCLAPTGCSQPPAIARTSFMLIGNEAPYTFNNTGWIPDTGLPVRTPADPNITDGNNLEAGVDRVAPNGVDPNGWAVGSPTRVFNQTYNPAPGNPPPGEEPLPPGPQPTPPTAFQQGVIAHGFYAVNRWHDEMYRFGFNEQARNYQHSNFGRGGVEGDRVSLEVQDSSGTNGANFMISADGVRPWLQMFIWTGGTPDRDGALDSTVLLHEMSHGLSVRLIGNAAGLTNNMSRAMGEGWSDFYPLALLSEPTDNRFGTNPVAGYVTYNVFAGFESNYYYGIRRFPVAIRASRGPNGLPHNPLTFRYVNAGCNDLIGDDVVHPNSAYPRGPIGSNSPCDQIHNMGEVWAATLWEVRDQLILRHGPTEGNRRVLQYVTDGMKLSPLGPTLLQMRDSILAAVTVSDVQDVGPVWRGFAARGMGTGATITAVGSGNNNTIVTESFAIPRFHQRPPKADFDGDGLSDVSVVRTASNHTWYMNRSTTGFFVTTFGLSTDKPMADDFDGDGKTDITVFRPTADPAIPDFYIMQSSTLTIKYVYWGTSGDTAFSEDIDGDNKADTTIYRPSTGRTWSIRSTDGTFTVSPEYFGNRRYAGDFDGDLRGDYAIFSGGVWRILLASDGHAESYVTNWGVDSDRLVPADYDGDGKDDLAVYRPSTGTWYILNSSGGNTIVNFGISTDVPVPADYDGDGRADIAVYRNGTWYLNRSTSGMFVTTFGLSSDLPVPAILIPN